MFFRKRSEPQPAIRDEVGVHPAQLERWPLRWFLIFGFIYLYAFPYFERLWSANEVPRIFQTQQIVDKGQLWIEPLITGEAARHALDVSIAPSGHRYPDKAPGLSFLAIPVYWLARIIGNPTIPLLTWLFRVTLITLPALAFLPLFFRMTRRFAPDEHARRMALAAYALASPALVYGMLFISHQLAAAFIGGAFMAAVALARGESKHPGGLALLAGFLAGLSVLIEYQSFIALLIVGIYFIARVPHRLRSIGLALLGATPPAIALCWYHQMAWGSPFKTGYSFSIQDTTHIGFLGMVGLTKQSAAIALITPTNGLLTLVPWTLFALVGAVAIARNREARARCGAEAIVCLSVLVLYVLFLSSLVPYMAQGGWSVGPRYMTAALPFVAYLAAAGFQAMDKSTVGKLLAQASVLAGVIIFMSAATTYPHWPDQLRNPLHDLVFPLLAQGYAVHSLGTAMGLTGLVSLIPLYTTTLAMALFLLVRVPNRRGMLGAALAVVLAVALITSYRAFPPTGPYKERAWSFVTGTWEPTRHP